MLSHLFADSRLIRWLFASSWRRSALALLVLLGILIYLGLLYIDAIAIDNQRRIENYRQRVGGSTAAQLWALSVQQRDSKLFVLHDRSWVNQSDLFMLLSQQEETVQPAGITPEQRQQLLEALRQSDLFRPPEVLDFATPFVLTPILDVGRRWELPDSDDPLDQQQQVLRWHQGVEFVESLSGGGILIQELVRLNLLTSFVESSQRWLSLDDEQELVRVANTLARIEPPRQAIVRAIQIETLVALNAFGDLWGDNGDTKPLIPFCFDLKYFLDRNVEWSLDPFDQDKIDLISEPPPFYAPITSVMTLGYAGVLSRVHAVDSGLLATRAAFDAMIAKKRGQEWQPPEGIVRIVSSDGTVRIRATEGPEGTDIYLPR